MKLWEKIRVSALNLRTFLLFFFFIKAMLLYVLWGVYSNSCRCCDTRYSGSCISTSGSSAMEFFMSLRLKLSNSEVRFTQFCLLLAEWPGYFTCHCGNKGVERTRNKSQHTKLTRGGKKYPAASAANFRSRVRRSNQQAGKIPLRRLRHLCCRCCCCCCCCCCCSFVVLFHPFLVDSGKKHSSQCVLFRCFGPRFAFHPWALAGITGIETRDFTVFVEIIMLSTTYVV